MATSNPALELNHHDLCQHASITVTIHGNETSWIGDIGGDDPETAVVLLRSKQLTLMGTLGSLEAVVSDWSALLAEARAHPEKWDEVPRRAMATTTSRESTNSFVRRADGGDVPRGPFLRSE